MHRSGVNLRKKCKILSGAGVTAVLTYTLNEGLRFGRGIDYNEYWRVYEIMGSGIDYGTNVGFLYLEKGLLFFNVPWQGCAMFMSFMFILGTLIFMKNYKDVMPIALPLWVLLFHNVANNLMRWNLAFSFIMIALFYLIINEGRLNVKFLVFCCIGCTIHYAILPVPFIFYFLYKIKKPIVSPFVCISVFIALSFLFQSEFMLRFVDLFNTLSALDDKFDSYGDDVEYWLTKSPGGSHNSSWIGPMDTFLGLFVTLVGHKSMRQAPKPYLFAYNLFLLGFMFRPATIQIELIHRYDELFFYQRVIVFGYVIFLYKKGLLIYKNLKMVPLMTTFIFFLCFLSGTKEVFREKEFKLWYVWNKEKQTPEDMLSLYHNDAWKNQKNN